MNEVVLFSIITCCTMETCFVLSVQSCKQQERALMDILKNKSGNVTLSKAFTGPVNSSMLDLYLYPVVWQYDPAVQVELRRGLQDKAFPYIGKKATVSLTEWGFPATEINRSQQASILLTLNLDSGRVPTVRVRALLRYRRIIRLCFVCLYVCEDRESVRVMDLQWRK